jgi:hypothetical protein
LVCLLQKAGELAAYRQFHDFALPAQHQFGRDEQCSLTVELYDLGYIGLFTSQHRISTCVSLPQSQLRIRGLLDVQLPTTDGRESVLIRYTHHEKDLQIQLTLPKQAPPKIQAPVPTSN